MTNPPTLTLANPELWYGFSLRRVARVNQACSCCRRRGCSPYLGFRPRRDGFEHGRSHLAAISTAGLSVVGAADAARSFRIRHGASTPYDRNPHSTPPLCCVAGETGSDARPIANGRLDLGVGGGWQSKEYEASGLDFGLRASSLTDTIAACKVLWQETPAEFASATIAFHDVYCEPKPLQSGGIPFWVAGTLHARNLERLARYGDGWIPIMGETLEGIAQASFASVRRCATRDEIQQASVYRFRYRSHVRPTANPTLPVAWRQCPRL